MRDATSPSRASPLGWIKDRLSLMFGLDLRALALFRIFYGLTVIGDLIDRAQDLEAHYTDNGVIPRWWVLKHYDRPQYINVHAMSGAYTFQAALFFIHACFAFCFTIGYKTKLFQFLTWLLVISLQLHNPVVGHGGDVYFRVMLLFSLFLPLEQLYSVDKFLEDRNKPPRDPERSPPSNGQHPYWIANLATAAFVGQAMCMYIASVYHKTGQEWTTTYTSTYYALQLDYFRTALGDLFLLGGNSAFLKLMTWAVYQWEYWGAWMLISPIFPQYSRALGSVGFMALHIGFGSCLRLGLFAFCTTFAAAALIPSFVWDFVFHHLWLKKVNGPARPNISYDSTNQFSTTVARAVNEFLLFGSAKMSPIGDTLAKLETGDSQPTETYSEPANHWLQTELRGSKSSDVDAVTAALQFSTLTALPALIIKKLVPSKWQVRLRQRFGGYLMQQYTTSPKVPNTKKTFQRQSFFRSLTQKYLGVNIAFREVLAFLLILFVLSWNLGNANSKFGPPPSIRPLAWVLRVDQSWGMFSPHPPKGVWWHVIRATLTDDSVVEIFKDEGLFRWEPSGPVTNDDDLYSPPNPFSASYGNHRWFKFWENGFNANTEDIRLNTGRWICRQWNTRHTGGNRLWQFQIILVQDSVHEDGSRSRAGHWEQWSHQCYDSKPSN